MASGPITSWQIEGGKVESVTDFIFLGSEITADGDCSHEIKWHLPLWRKAMTNPDCVLKSRDITLPYNQSYGSSSSHVWMWNWTIKKSERSRTDAFKLWCWRRFLRVPWMARRANQSILGNKPWIFIGRTNAETEAPILPHMMWRADSLEKTLMWGKTEGKRRRGRQRLRRLDSSTNS